MEVDGVVVPVVGAVREGQGGQVPPLGCQVQGEVVWCRRQWQIRMTISKKLPHSDSANFEPAGEAFVIFQHSAAL